MARIAKKANIVPIFSSAQTRMEWGFCFGEKSEVSINREVLSKIYENQTPLIFSTRQLATLNIGCFEMGSTQSRVR